MSVEGAMGLGLRSLAADGRGSRSSLFCRPACRICLCEASENEGSPDLNPLVAPCRCKGSMQFVHLQCLRTWMEGRLNIRNDGTTVGYFLRSLDCELCKAPYPPLVEANRKMIELFAIPRPQYPYFILEPRNAGQPPPSGGAVRGLHVVSLANRRIARLGRGHDSDVRLSDISVSRFHAVIRHHQGAFYLEDQRSKFGTLLELKRPLKLERGISGVSLQVGRTVISISIRRQWHVLPACLRAQRSLDADVRFVEAVGPQGSSGAIGVFSWPSLIGGTGGPPPSGAPPPPSGASRLSALMHRQTAAASPRQQQQQPPPPNEPQQQPDEGQQQQQQQTAEREEEEVAAAGLSNNPAAAAAAQQGPLRVD